VTFSSSRLITELLAYLAINDTIFLFFANVKSFSQNQDHIEILYILHPHQVQANTFLKGVSAMWLLIASHFKIIITFICR